MKFLSIFLLFLFLSGCSKCADLDKDGVCDYYDKDPTDITPTDITPTECNSSIQSTTLLSQYPEGIEIRKGDGTKIGCLVDVLKNDIPSDDTWFVQSNRYEVILPTGYIVILDKEGNSDPYVSTDIEPRNAVMLYIKEYNIMVLHYNAIISFFPVDQFQFATKMYFREVASGANLPMEITNPKWYYGSVDKNNISSKEYETYEQGPNYVSTGSYVTSQKEGGVLNRVYYKNYYPWKDVRGVLLNPAESSTDLEEIFGSQASELDDMSDAGNLKAIDLSTNLEISLSSLPVTNDLDSFLN